MFRRNTALFLTFAICVTMVHSNKTTTKGKHNTTIDKHSEHSSTTEKHNTSFEQHMEPTTKRSKHQTETEESEVEYNLSGLARDKANADAGVIDKMKQMYHRNQINQLNQISREYQEETEESEDDYNLSELAKDKAVDDVIGQMNKINKNRNKYVDFSDKNKTKKTVYDIRKAIDKFIVDNNLKLKKTLDD